jgi:hypothetical protein
MNAQDIREHLGGSWTARPDGWWRSLDLERLRASAAGMKAGGARFAALTVRPDGASMRLAWHWDVAGTLLSLQAELAPGAAIPSIADLWPGADWAEREARDYYAVTFSGRDETPTLMLREGDAPGVLLRGKEAR